MDGEVIVVVAIASAICLRMFWREIIEFGIFMVLVSIIGGILMIAAAAQGALGR